MGETRVDLHHLLEDLRDAYPGSLLDQTLPGDLPDSIVAAIRVGFRRLSLEARRTLRTAAMLDDHATLRELTAITGFAEDAAAAALDELPAVRPPRSRYSVIGVLRAVRGLVKREFRAISPPAPFGANATS